MCAFSQNQKALTFRYPSCNFFSLASDKKFCFFYGNSITLMFYYCILSGTKKNKIPTVQIQMRVILRKITNYKRKHKYHKKQLLHCSMLAVDCEIMHKCGLFIASLETQQEPKY